MAPHDGSEDIMLLSELGTPVLELKEQIFNTWGRL
jgi:hypothetical protein